MMTSRKDVSQRLGGGSKQREKFGQLGAQSIDAYAIKTLVDSGDFDCGQVFKMVLICQHDGARPIVDALTRANLSQIESVSREVCALLDQVRAADDNLDM